MTGTVEFHSPESKRILKVNINSIECQSMVIMCKDNVELAMMCYWVSCGVSWDEADRAVAGFTSNADAVALIAQMSS